MRKHDKHKSDLIKHQKTTKHLSNAKEIKLQRGINKIYQPLTKNKNITKLELRLATYVTCYSAIQTINYLTDLFKTEISKIYANDNNNSNNGVMNYLKLHRTKCAVIVKNMISPSIIRIRILLEEVGKCYFTFEPNENMLQYNSSIYNNF